MGVAVELREDGCCFLGLLWLPTQMAWVYPGTHGVGRSSVQALMASSSFRMITGIGTTFGLSHHVGGRRLCLKIFVWVIRGNGVCFGVCVCVFVGGSCLLFCVGFGFVWLCSGLVLGD